MSKQADEIIEILRAGHDDLDAFVRGLRPEDLTRGSAAAEWTVAQVLSHLGSGAEIFLAIVDGALAGTGMPEGNFNQSVWDRWNAMSPDEQAAGFLTANEKLVQGYEALDGGQREDVRFAFGWMPEPVDLATAAGMRLNEFILHSWDVRAAFDASAVLRPDAVGRLLDGVGGTIAWAGKADRLDGSAQIAVRTTDPKRAFGLSIDESAQIVDLPDTADGEFVAPAEYVVRFLTGRHGVQYTPTSVEFTSEKLTLDDLRKVFPGY